ncbi:AAA family ATPase [Bradyrhizobium sp. AZCC 2230]|uniref:AAA family ATPase n=1 Tax=Bradyrhizobium sp. AZCC 2230 TaxID=3117021 RepID=UPI002FEEDE82
MTSVISSTPTVAAATNFLNFAEQQGFALVKVHPGEKRPVGNDWQNSASRNRADWERWQAEGFNLGVHAGASGLVIVDLDVKHGGIEAVRLRLDTWCLNNGIAALAHHVTTPSGGQHIYLRVANGVDALALSGDTAGALGKGVDVLAGNKQALAPGSAIGTGRYTFHGAPLYGAPQFVVDFCTRAPAPVASVTAPSGLDQGDMAKMLEYLTERGEFESYEAWLAAGMALKVEFGGAGLALWALTHNDTVTPDVIESKWKSFASEPKPGGVSILSLMWRAHALGWKGQIQPPGMFKGAAQHAAAAGAPGMPTIASPPLVPGTPGPLKKLGDWLGTFVVPQYLWDGILIRRFCYSLTAQTGTGKTAIALLLAIHVGRGKVLANRKVKRGTVIYLAGENPADVQMRFLGICHEMGVDPNTLDIYVLDGSGDFMNHAALIRTQCEADRLEPALVIVDTAAAYFPGEDGNSNEQQGAYARQLRALCTLPGGPTVVVLAHPTKNAKEIGEMVPRGGSAFIAEVDGNIGLARSGSTIGLQAIGKFRGPEFTPMHFGLHAVQDCPVLFDAENNRTMPTVVAHEVSEAGAEARAAESETAEIQLLRDIYDHPGEPTRKRAARLGCHHDTVASRIKRLVGRKMVDDSGFKLKLTGKGEKELNALERDKSLSEGSDNAFPFPVPGGK